MGTYAKTTPDAFKIEALWSQLWQVFFLQAWCMTKSPFMKNKSLNALPFHPSSHHLCYSMNLKMPSCACKIVRSLLHESVQPSIRLSSYNSRAVAWQYNTLLLHSTATNITLEWTSKFECNNVHMNEQVWLWQWLQMSKFDCNEDRNEQSHNRSWWKPQSRIKCSIARRITMYNCIIDCNDNFNRWSKVQLWWGSQQIIALLIATMTMINDPMFDPDENHDEQLADQSQWQLRRIATNNDTIHCYDDHNRSLNVRLQWGLKWMIWSQW